MVNRLNILFSLIVFAGWLLLGSPCFASDETQPDLTPYQNLVITQLTIEGNRVTKEWVIAREIWSEVGDKMDPQLVLADLTRLSNLAIFGSTLVIPAEHEGGVSLNYIFSEMPWIIPFPAMRYTEENGFSVGVGTASPNFLGRGVALSGSAVFGGATMYKIAASNPWISGNHVSAGFLASHQTRPNELLDFEQTSDMIRFHTGKYIGKNGRLELHGGYYGVKSDQPGRTLDPDNSDELWFGALLLGYDGRDDWRWTSTGWHNEISVLYMGGSADTWTVNLDLRRYQPVGPRHTLATGPYMALQTGNVGEDIPPYMQYFIGGANSVRGYKLEEQGKKIFGKNQLLYTLEYRYLWKPVTPLTIHKWTFSLGLELAAFGDAGIAWSDPKDFNFDRASSGYGVGIRLLVPGLDSLRFDVARSEDGDTVFNFGIHSVFDDRKLRVR